MALRRALVAIALCTSLVLAACGDGTTGAKAKGPNIVVIETDDQDAASVAQMPNVQRLLAAEGTTFTNSFVSDSLCCPSRATFLTGQYAHNHHVLSNKPPDGGFKRLRASNALPVWLKRAGYRTVLIGKYLNGFGAGKKKLPPRPPGWTSFFALLDPSTRYLKFPVDDNGVRRRYESPGTYQTDVLADTAVRSIERSTRDRRPFMLWLTPAAPHDPATPAPRHVGLTDTSPVPQSYALNEEDVSDKPSFIRALPLIKPPKLAKLADRYRRRLATLLAVDEAVGRIVDALTTSGQLARTVVVFTSDNGWMTGQHRIPSGKRVPYEESIRVPLIVRGPGFPRGAVRSAPVANVDLAPTIVSLARARAGVRMDGCSLHPLAARASAHWQRNLLFENLTTTGLGGEGDKVKGLPKYAAIRSGRFMWVEYANGERELYDLVADPDELANRATEATLADARALLSRRLARLRKGPAPVCKLVG